MATSMRTEATGDHDRSTRFEQWPELSRLQNDRFCHSCGYNLHQQSVRREPATQVLMCRCPECGTFHPVIAPANAWQAWTQRLKGLLMLVWMASVASIAFLVGLFHGVAIYFTLDEFTGYFIRPPAGQSWSTGARYVWDINPYYWEHTEMWALVCLISGGSSFGLAFVGTILALIFLPHWPRRAHLAVILVWAVLPAAITAVAFWFEPSRLENQVRWNLLAWGMPYVVTYVCCYVIGGLLALWIGRRLVRLAVRIFVPPRWRVYLEAITPR